MSEYLELIDTCWDVNVEYKKAQGNPLEELIDTCWDVNTRGKTAVKQYSRINRYMLGCKLRFVASRGMFATELIDTCWDVNYVNMQDLDPWTDGINRYMLGCKF